MPVQSPSLPTPHDALHPAVYSRQGMLAQALQELFTVAVRLRRKDAKAPPNAERFRENVHQTVASASREAKRLGYGDEYIGYALYAAVAYLDESVLSLAAPSLASWQGRPLQEELFQVHVGGDVFFAYLETLLGHENSSELGDVLEVYQLCLLLDFRGRYGTGRQAELQRWIVRLRDRLADIRGPLGDLAPQWAPPQLEQVQSRRDEWQRRLVLAIAGVLSVTVVLLVIFTLILGSRVGALATGR